MLIIRLFKKFYGSNKIHTWLLWDNFHENSFHVWFVLEKMATSKISTHKSLRMHPCSMNSIGVIQAPDSTILFTEVSVRMEINFVKIILLYRSKNQFITYWPMSSRFCLLEHLNFGRMKIIIRSKEKRENCRIDVILVLVTLFFTLVILSAELKFHWRTWGYSFIAEKVNWNFRINILLTHLIHPQTRNFIEFTQYFSKSITIFMSFANNNALLVRVTFHCDQ